MSLSKQVLDACFKQYLHTKEECSKTKDWAKYAKMFVDSDQALVDHHGFGLFKGRKAIEEYIVKSIAPFGTMFFSIDWVSYDEVTGAVVFQVQNILPDPPVDVNGKPFQFPNWTRLVFDPTTKKLISEETVYNPLRDAGKTVKAWHEAGGKFVSKEQLKYKYSSYPTKKSNM